MGVQAKGVCMVRLVVRGRAAHGSTPWLGDNAILKAIDVFRRIQTLPFAAESSEMFDRPSINLGRLNAGDAVNKVPDEAVMAVDIRYLPGQEPGEILDADPRRCPTSRWSRTFIRPPALVSPRNPFVVTLCEAVRRAGQREAMSVGRDGASDAISFLAVGIPAVEFGPSAPATTGRTSGSRSPRWPATGRRWWTSCAACRPWPPRVGRGRLRALEGGLSAVMEKPARPGLTLIKRAAIASVLVVLMSAAAVSAAVFLQVDDVRQTFIDVQGGRKPIAIDEITPAEAGKPQTIMVLGTDEPARRRRGAGGEAALGHDPAGAAGRAQGIDHADVDPA